MLAGTQPNLEATVAHLLDLALQLRDLLRVRHRPLPLLRPHLHLILLLQVHLHGLEEVRQVLLKVGGDGGAIDDTDEQRL